MGTRSFSFQPVTRITVKVGSGILTRKNGLDLNVVSSISSQISALMDRDIQVLLVSSGAMAAGLRKLKLPARPDEIPLRQAIASVGQSSLMLEYENAFSPFNKKVAQILLTGDGLVSRKRYLNARNTLHTLLSWKVVPVINENDTVSVDEIRFGDNDNLGAMITLMMGSDILINLTDIDGLFTADPRNDPDARLIPEVSSINRYIETIAGSLPGALGTGGMRTKIRAAKKLTSAGIPMVIANGRTENVLLRLFSGEALGTFFIPKEQKMGNRKCWIGYNLKPQGIIYVDKGAAAALLNRGKSLLPGGITRVEGDFGVGSAVTVVNGTFGTIGTGLVNYSAQDIRRIMGKKTKEISDVLGEKPYDEIIHRDNLAVTGEALG